MKTQYRIANMKVDRIYQVTPLVGGSKDADGNPVMFYGESKWFVHFEGSHESLCLGPDKPEIMVGQLFDVILEPK